MGARALLPVAVLICVVLGFLLGSAVGKRKAVVDSPESETAIDDPPQPPPAGGTAARPPGDAALLAEKASLEASVRELEANLPPAPSLEQRRAKVRRYIKLVERAHGGSNCALLEIEALWSSFDEGMAPILIEFLEGPHDDELNNQIIQGIIASGGPAAADFFARALTDTASPDRRGRVIDIVAGAFESHLKRLPVSGHLLAAARQLLAGSSPEERLLAVTLVGRAPGTQAEILRVAREDADDGVRARALDQLADFGDAAALEWLEKERIPALQSAGYSEREGARRAAAAIRERLKR